MSKAIISNRIYLDNPGVDITKQITKALTYKFSKTVGSNKFANVETVKTYKMLPNGIISIPQLRGDLIPEGYEIIDKRILCSIPFPNSLYDMYPEQQVVYDEISDSCILNALVGWGKSFTALHIARKLAQKTLIVVHTTALRDQWAESVQALFGIEAGIIGSGIIDYEDHPIVISNTQTLVKHTNEVSKVFGTVIVDECHHVPSTTFTNIVDTSHARYKIGLSGTLVRKDGKHALFPDYFGDRILRPPQSNTMAPTVKLIKTGVALNASKLWVYRVNELLENVEYQKFIAAIAIAQIELGHYVLLLSERVEFLRKMQDMIGDRCVIVTGAIGDRVEAKNQILSGEKKCIAGSRQIFSEGISIDRLSCVILTSPMNNDSLLEQIVGRVQRQYPDKLTPVVIDMQFSGRTDKIQNNSRIGLYLRKGWSIETIA